MTMTNISFSFLGLINLTRSDSSEGWTYITSIWYPRQACVKIIGVLSRNGEQKLEVFHQFYSLKATCRPWTLTLICCSCRVLGHPHSVTCLFGFWAIYLNLSYDLCHITMTFDPMMSNFAKLWRCVIHMFKRSLPTCTLSNHLGLLSLIFFLFRVNNEGFIMTFLRRIASYRLQLII